LLCGGEARFSDTGVAEYCVLGNDTAFAVGKRDVLFDSDDAHSVSFHPNGAFRAGFPAEPVVLDYEGSETTVGPDTYMEFDEDGTLILLQPQD
jgi:hypothetical protein